ncbi:MAG: hypothetical protein ACP6IY_14890, partial [Promethearchaeia archaeon]
MTDPHLKNDDQGSKPLELHECLAHLIGVVFMLLAAFGEFLAKLINSAVKAGLEAVMTIARAVMAAIEAMMKAALLAWIYKEFAETSLICLSIMSVFFLFLKVFKNFYEIDIENNVMEIHTSGFFTLSIIMEVGYKYDKFLDIDLPFFKFIFETPKIIANFIFYFFEFQVKIEKFIFGNETAPSIISNVLDFLSSMGDAMTINGGFVGIHAIILKVKEESWASTFVKGIGLYIIGVILWLILLFDDFNFNKIIGISLGFFVSALIFLFLYRYLKSKEHTRPKNIHKQYMKKFEEIFRIKSAKNPDGFIPIKVLTILDAILGYIDIELKFRDIVIDEDQSASQQAAETTISVFAGFLSMFLACYSIINFSGEKFNKKMKVAKFYSFITFFIGLTILHIISILYEKNENLIR